MNILVLDFEQVLHDDFFGIFSETNVAKAWFDCHHDGIDLVLVLEDAIAFKVGVESEWLVVD